MTEKWVRDSGLVFALLFLILGIRGQGVYLWVSAVLLTLVLVYPKTFTPLAWLWQKLAEGLAFVMHKVFFGVAFFGIVVPVALVRRVLHGNQQDRRKNTDRMSAFVPSRGVVLGVDLEKPY